MKKSNKSNTKQANETNSFVKEVIIVYKGLWERLAPQLKEISRPYFDDESASKLNINEIKLETQEKGTELGKLKEALIKTRKILLEELQKEASRIEKNIRSNSQPQQKNAINEIIKSYNGITDFFSTNYFNNKQLDSTNLQSITKSLNSLAKNIHEINSNAKKASEIVQLAIFSLIGCIVITILSPLLALSCAAFFNLAPSIELRSKKIESATVSGFFFLAGLVLFPVIAALFLAFSPVIGGAAGFFIGNIKFFDEKLADISRFEGTQGRLKNIKLN